MTLDEQVAEIIAGPVGARFQTHVGAGWVVHALEQAAHALGDFEEEPSEYALMLQGLRALQDVAPQLEELQRQGIAAVVRQLHAEDERQADAAIRYYLGELATPEQRSAALQEVTGAALKEATRRRIIRESIWDAVGSIGLETLQRLAPLLLAAL